MEQQLFIGKIKDKAIELQSTHKILSSITISQAILESGWGTSELYQNANNCFGIKWAEGCGYDKYLINTKEIVNGKEITVQAYFRKYNTLEDSIVDHAVFLQKKRYENILGDTNYSSVAAKLYTDGYSTSPEYPNKLIKLIDQYNLDQYDMKEGNKMIIGLRGGHSSNCIGAVGLVNEYEQMQKFYEVVAALLRSMGHTVIDCNSNGSNASTELSEGAAAANNAKVDIFISLHMNAFNGQGHGVEALVSSATSKAVAAAQRLCDNFAALGFTNRGVKYVLDYEMNHVAAPNIIFEMCFCDNAADIEIYNNYSWDQLAHLFCNAINSDVPKETKYINKQTGYVVTNYLPNGYKGDGSFEGVDLEYILGYFKDIKCYVRGNTKGIWIETQVLPIAKCNELKNTLGSWFYSIK